MIHVIVVESLSHVRLFCDPMNCKSPGFSVHGISQARILKWIAVSFSRKIFSTQGLNPCLLNTCPTLQADSLPLSHQDHNGPCFGSNDSAIMWKCHLGLYLSFLIRVFFCFELLKPKTLASEFDLVRCFHFLYLSR